MSRNILDQTADAEPYDLSCLDRPRVRNRDETDVGMCVMGRGGDEADVVDVVDVAPDSGLDAACCDVYWRRRGETVGSGSPSWLLATWAVARLLVAQLGSVEAAREAAKFVGRVLADHFSEDWPGGQLEAQMELRAALCKYDIDKDPIGAAAIWAREMEATTPLPCLRSIEIEPARLVFLMGVHNARLHGGSEFWMPERHIVDALGYTRRIINTAFRSELRPAGLIRKVGEEKYGSQAAEYRLFASPSDILAGAVPEPPGDCSRTENGELVGCVTGGDEDDLGLPI